ncbi:MAG: 30S ribosome-binding factor RbfA [Bacteroidota bacterium]
MGVRIKQQQVAALVQRALGEIFLREGASYTAGTLVTVKEVCMNTNLSLAQVYLSFLDATRATHLLRMLTQHQKALRGLLGHKIGSKVRRVPELRFHIDHSLARAQRIHQLLDTLDTT